MSDEDGSGLKCGSGFLEDGADDGQEDYTSGDEYVDYPNDGQEDFRSSAKNFVGARGGGGSGARRQDRFDGEYDDDEDVSWGDDLSEEDDRASSSNHHVGYQENSSSSFPQRRGVDEGSIDQEYDPWKEVKVSVELNHSLNELSKENGKRGVVSLGENVAGIFEDKGKSRSKFHVLQSIVLTKIQNFTPASVAIHIQGLPQSAQVSKCCTMDGKEAAYVAFPQEHNTSLNEEIVKCGGLVNSIFLKDYPDYNASNIQDKLQVLDNGQTLIPENHPLHEFIVMAVEKSGQQDIRLDKSVRGYVTVPTADANRMKDVLTEQIGENLPIQNIYDLKFKFTRALMDSACATIKRKPGQEWIEPAGLVDPKIGSFSNIENPKSLQKMLDKKVTIRAEFLITYKNAGD